MADERKDSKAKGASSKAPAKRRSLRRKPAAKTSSSKAKPAKKPAAKETATKGKGAAAEATSKTADTKATAASKTRAPSKRRASSKPTSSSKAKAAAKTRSSSRKPAASRAKAAPEPEPAAPVVNARARYVRVAPRKARLIADQIRGLPLTDAQTLLRFSPRGAAQDIAKLINSAAANAENNHDLVADELVVTSINVDEGPTLRRFRPRALGRATRINKRTCHIAVALTPED